ncbi:MAG TPA: heavy metal-binding domain-containing protein [Acidimicrobiales bacterium]|nr:heavy metal-binding domain-containing protein [Acidimicrobiales bacterium]
MSAPGKAGAAAEAVDLKAEMRRAADSLGQPAHDQRTRAVTSDLSVDEALLLHSIGWEAVDVVFGASVVSIPPGVWTWGSGEITSASDAHNLAVRSAAKHLGEQCAGVHGHGVVGVQVGVEVQRHHVDVELTGTAVRPVTGKDRNTVFVSDLSARDFTLLHNAGWGPIGLAFGASFVYAPRRSMGTTMRQSSQNVELTNFTEAMYAAREAGMEHMQRSALDMGAQGIVAVRVSEGPMWFASHAIGFTAWGTAVRLDAQSHQYLRPEVVLPLDDAVVEFEAQALR